MLVVKDILKVLKSYNIDSTNFGPSIYKSNSDIGLSLEIKDDTFGFLTRYFIFQTKKELEEFLKSFFWYKKNKDKWKISLSLDNYETPNPKIKYTYNDRELNYNDMINLETNIANAEKENNEDIERNSLMINIEGLTNYLINLKENKYKIRKEKNNLKIKENELKYELLEALNKYYGKTKAITKRPVNLDIINNSNDKDQLQENLKNIKQKSINEIEAYLNNLIDIVKNEELEDKYIRLLLTRCLNFNNSKSLLIHCNLKEHLEFAFKVKMIAKEMGITDVCIHLNDLDEIHSYLRATALEDIALNSIIDKSDWDTYAIKGGSILFLDSTVPGLMQDIEPEKIERMRQVTSKTITFYRAMVEKNAFPWCIAALPNERWAKSIFGDTKDAYQKLYLNIFKMCMVDTSDPVQSWEDFIGRSNKLKDKLNNLGIRKMHYQNALGTDLTVSFSGQNFWLNLDKKSSNGGKVIVNMRNKIISWGGEFLYNSMVTDILVDDNKVSGVEINNKEIIKKFSL